MTVWIEGKSAFYFGTQAHLIDNTLERAWVEKHVIENPAHAWLVAKYVEADKANSNGQYFSLDGLRMAQPTISHSPMNWNHQARNISGAWVASEFIYPTQETSEAFNPYIETLGVFWRAYFPEQYKLVKQAHEEGSLYVSMECAPKKIACIGPNGCNGEFDYEGAQSASYCDHLNSRSSHRHLISPHFTAGALILPPVKPGWSNADVKALVARHAEAAERAYSGIAEELPHLDAEKWEGLMTQVLAFTDNEAARRLQK